MKIEYIKKYSITMTLALVSLLALCFYMFFENPTLQFSPKEIALAIFSTGFVMLIYELIYSSKNEKLLHELIGEKIPIYLKMKAAGIENISDEFYLHRYKDTIKAADHLTIVMNDGKSFFGSNSDIIKPRFKQKGKKTTFILLDPRASSVNLLNVKNGKPGNFYYQNKILDAINELLVDPDLAVDHTLEVLIHKSFNTMSIVTFNNIAIISLYRLSAGKSKVPHIEFHKVGDDCEFTSIIEDVDRLKREAELVTKASYQGLKLETENLMHQNSK